MSAPLPAPILDAEHSAALEKIARCELAGQPPRALLALATGAGKTFIAVNLLKRIADAGQLRRALFVCDRDELRLQASGAFQNLFGADAAVVSAREPQKNARILIATYQTLDVADEGATANFLTNNYPENYFSHIVIDECHRSAWGKWSQVFTRNPSAVQIGLTATPRELELSARSAEAAADAQITADNVKHFGEPVYEYDIGQGIEDGYLAACEIRQGRVDIDQRAFTVDEILALNPVNPNTGAPATRDQLRELYEKTSYEDRILLPDRVYAMCRDLFELLLDTGGPQQKTIIFCVRDRHADDVARVLNNLYTEWCAEQGVERAEHYAFKCTAASSGGDYLADLRGSSSDYFVATTVDLLTTGVDVPAVRNIVFFRYVNSPISFYQMIGRGTRLDVASGKLMFRVYDYTDATRLFGETFLTKLRGPRKTSERPEGYDADEPPEPPVQVAGLEVGVTEAGRYIITLVDGKSTKVTVEEYKQRLAARLVAEAPTLEDFRARWIEAPDRETLLAALPDGGRSAQVVRLLDQMDDYDLYDVLADLAYGMAPRTRAERAGAFSYKHEGWLAAMPKPAALTLRALASQFARNGTAELENPRIFQTPEVKRAGGLPALELLGKPNQILHETKERLFAA